MRHLLHSGLFLLALTAATQASADDDSDDRRDRRVIVVSKKRHHRALPVRAGVDPSDRVYDPPPARYESSRATYDSRYVFRHRTHALAAARENVRDQEHDLERIVRIANRWHEATANRNPHALRKIESRLDDWIEREITESRHDPYDRAYAQRLRTLRRELHATAYGRFAYDDGYGRRNGRGYGRGWRRTIAYKARILDELIELSERQVYRAQARLRHPVRFSLAYR